MTIPYIIRKLIGNPILRHRMKTLHAFERMTHDPEAAQARKLREILGEISGSKLATAFQVHPKMTPESFRAALDVSGYERMRPWIEQVLQGDRSAMFSKQSQLMMFAMTSGTTGVSKYIPVTRSSFEEYRRSWTIWGCGVARDWPLIPNGGVLNLASAPFSKTTAAGVPAGSISGMLFRAMHYTMRFTNSVPPVLADVEETDARIYLALRLALTRQDTRMLTTANPSTLLTVAQKLNLWREDLMRDLTDGTLRASDTYAPAVVKQLRSLLRTKHPEVARQIGKNPSDTLLPRQAWPNLELLGVWTGGTLASYLPEVHHVYGHNIAMRDHGLSASECRMTIPFADHTSSGVLNIDGGFFEFIPVSDYEKGQMRTLAPWELTEQQDYYIIMSTSGGLLRYDISDVVRCTGFYNRTPCLKFLNKGSQIGNLTGEKLSAWQVTTGMQRWFSRAGNPSFEYVVTPHFSKQPGYVVLVERNSAARISSHTALLEHLDHQWSELNMEYEEKRRSGRLAPPRLEIIENGSFHSLKLARIHKLGGTFEQYKHPFFSTDSTLLSQLGLKIDDTSGEQQCS